MSGKICKSGMKRAGVVVEDSKHGEVETLVEVHLHLDSIMLASRTYLPGTALGNNVVCFFLPLLLLGLP